MFLRLKSLHLFYSFYAHAFLKSADEDRATYADDVGPTEPPLAIPDNQEALEQQQSATPDAWEEEERVLTELSAFDEKGEVDGTLYDNKNVFQEVMTKIE